MKRLMIFIAFLALSKIGLAQNYNDSIHNYKNSSDNYENSENNYKNSPNNYANSQNNLQRNSILDENGNSTGYVVPKEDGGANLFSNDGKRIGYISENDDNSGGSYGKRKE